MSLGVAFAGEPALIDGEPYVTTTMDSLSALLTVVNHSEGSIKGRISQTVHDAEGRLAIEIKPKDFAVPPAGRGVEGIYSRAPEGVKMWSPESPYLYKVTTNVSFEGGGEYSFTCDAGFRTFEVRDGHFYLNGHPYFLRGISRMPQGRLSDDSGRLDPNLWRSDDFIRGFYKKLKAANINSGRISGNLDGEEKWLEYADRMGVIMICGSYSGAGSTRSDVIASNRAVFVSAILKARNHTSAAVYTLANELEWDKNPDYLPGAFQNYFLARALDPARLFIGNAGFGEGKAADIDDRHDYKGWYSGDITRGDEYGGTGRKINYSVGAGNGKPVTFTEMVGAYTNDVDGRFQMALNKHAGNAMRLVGTSDDFRADSLRMQGILTKEMVEAMRRARGSANRISGTYPFSTYWSWDAASGEMIAKPAVDELALSYSPILLSLYSWKRHIYAGQTFSADLYIVNDDATRDSLKASRARIDLSQNGRVLSSIEVATPEVSYYDTAKVRVELKVPESAQAGEARLDVRLLDPASKSANTMAIFIAPRAWSRAASSAEVAVYDPQGATAALVRKLGFKVMPVDGLAAAGTALPLVIGAGAISNSTKSDAEAMWSLVERGGRVLVLEQSSIPAGMLPNGTKLKICSELLVNIDRGGTHPLMNGLRQRDIYLFNDVGTERTDCYAVKRCFDIDQAALADIEVMANAGSHLRRAVIAECFRGKGSVIYSQAECVSRGGDDPVADKVLSNVLSYLVSGEHSFGEQSGWKVNFADFVSERGLFGMPLQQGMILNTHNEGRVSYGAASERRIWSAGWPDGRRAVGAQVTDGPLGNLKALDPVAGVGKGVFWVVPPKEAVKVSISATNPSDVPVWFEVKLNDNGSGSRYELMPGRKGTFGPLSLPRGDRPAVKFTIEAPIDANGLGKGRKIVREPVFNGIEFLR